MLLQQHQQQQELLKTPMLLQLLLLATSRWCTRMMWRVWAGWCLALLCQVSAALALCAASQVSQSPGFTARKLCMRTCSSARHAEGAKNTPAARGLLQETATLCVCCCCAQMLHRQTSFGWASTPIRS
ncbi:hypothetical protein COO60DRAFT_48240 [Scenedesmus sp. NREL 46B-D3]|nr:hypothetical protein COO60DRAFT_48240 [Scenedesmus sp. NREL 46B-D3]